tara:strand:+ start:873 stop:1475 length:603 start_codon:yes stop_codon:yes gene_type:complete
MSDETKNLLQENTIKRFMTLAGNQKLSETFLTENKQLWEQELPPPEGEEFPPEGLEGEEFPPEGLEGEEMDFEDEEPVADVDLSAEEARVIADLGARLEAELAGEEEEEFEGEEGLDMGPEAEAAEAGMPPSPEMAGPPPEALEEAFVGELSRRVTERVRKEQYAQQLQEEIAQRVRKEQLVETVMKRVARRIRKAKKGR